MAPHSKKWEPVDSGFLSVLFVLFLLYSYPEFQFKGSVCLMLTVCSEDSLQRRESCSLTSFILFGNQTLRSLVLLDKMVFIVRKCWKFWENSACDRPFPHNILSYYRKGWRACIFNTGVILIWLKNRHRNEAAAFFMKSLHKTKLAH